LVLDNACYQKCQSVFEKASALGIELLYLPGYSANLNLIERLWRFVKKEVLYSRYYETFASRKWVVLEVKTREIVGLYR
jgi:transposase